MNIETDTKRIPAIGDPERQLGLLRRLLASLLESLRDLGFESQRNDEKTATTARGRRTNDIGVPTMARQTQRSEVRRGLNGNGSATAQDQIEFRDFVDQMMLELQLSDDELSERFDVPLSVVRGWRSGDAVAHPVVRQDVVAFLRARVAREGGARSSSKP